MAKRKAKVFISDIQLEDSQEVLTKGDPWNPPELAGYEFEVPLSQIEFDTTPIGYVNNHYHLDGTTILNIGKGKDDDGCELVQPEDLPVDTPLYHHPQELPDDVADYLKSLSRSLGELRIRLARHDRDIGVTAKMLLEKYGGEG